jgi:hypothetical protein
MRVKAPDGAGMRLDAQDAMRMRVHAQDAAGACAGVAACCGWPVEYQPANHAASAH